MIKQEYHIELAILTEEGKVEKVFYIPFGSFLTNWSLMQYAGETYTTSFNITTTTGASTPLSITSGTFMNVTAASGAMVTGIVIGSSSVPVLSNQYALQGQLSTGSFLHYPTTYALPTTTGSGTTAEIRRGFKNITAATISVTETGMYVAGGGTATTRIAIVRDVFSSVPVDPNATLEVRYIFSIITT